MPIFIPHEPHPATISDEELELLKAEIADLTQTKRRGYRLAKRAFDIVFSALALICLLPFLLLIALCVFLDDPHGSPIYIQTRVGRGGRTFRFYKFRSMVVGADKLLDSLQTQNEKSGPVFKMKDDPRITRIGRILRKTSLDELPQFFNVLIGDMSAVGPRPALPDEVAQYSDYHRLRLAVTPGLTCFWQTCDHRDAIDFDDWVKMDLRYIREASFSLDIKLILRTVKVMFTGEGT